MLGAWLALFLCAEPSPPPKLASPDAAPSVTSPETTGIRRGATLTLNLGAITYGGAQPTSLFGVTLGGRLGGTFWSGVFEGWTIFPTTLTAGERASVDVWSFGATTGGCAQLQFSSADLLPCVLVRAGAAHFDPRHLELTTPKWQPTLAAGARLRTEWPRDNVLAFFLALDAFVPVLRLRVRGDAAWDQPWIFGGAVLGALVRLK